MNNYLTIYHNSNLQSEMSYWRFYNIVLRILDIDQSKVTSSSLKHDIKLHAGTISSLLQE